jgi:ubiquinone/menaquinone biosynthesis C-methylase UbiE
MFHPHGPTFFELAEQALSSTERGYDLLAPKFDYTPFRTPQELVDAVGVWLEPMGPFGRGLDLCCGTGAGLVMLRRVCRERIVGIDISRGMLEVCRRRIGGLSGGDGTAPIELVRGNALALPFSAEFDLVVCFGALGHILPRDAPRFVSEIYRVLRPGGRFVFVTSPWPSIWSLSYWLARGFNAAMHVRNALMRPPFIMYYLTFLLPEARTLLENHGFAVEAQPLPFTEVWGPLHLVCATKRATAHRPEE